MTRSFGNEPTMAQRLVGSQIGNWTIVAPRDRTTKVLARCGCGVEKVVALSNLVRGQTRSCGCQKAALISKRFRTHGASGSRAYKAWKNMVKRCAAETGHHFERYGRRGISVCAAWRHSFERFIADIGPMPARGLTVERIDNDKGYEPGNVRWATMKEQGRNRTSNRLLTFNGKTLCVAEWAELTGIREGVIRQRIDRDGWTIGRALSTPTPSSCPAPAAEELAS